MKCTPAQVGKTPADRTKVFFLTEIVQIVSSVFVKSGSRRPLGTTFSRTRTVRSAKNA